MEIKILITGLIVSLFCVSSFAHQDRIILLEEERLDGLPEQYQPATLSISNQQLTIGQNTVVIPDCIWNRFGDTQKSPLKFGASWYHEQYEGGLPPYMRIWNSHFRLLLNLDSLEIIDVNWNPKVPAEH